jgi:hypothetical protein
MMIHYNKGSHKVSTSGSTPYSVAVLMSSVPISECCQKLKMEATSMFCLFYKNASGIMNVTT